MKSRGFTLLEMVVTVLIFGIVGVIAIQLLTQSVRTTEKVMHRSSVLSEWHRAMNVLAQDFVQIAHRSIRDEYGDRQPSVVIRTNGEIEFTRSGWPNTLGYQRSNLQRVGYFLHENQFVRRYWDVLDRAVDITSVNQILLHNVHSIEFEVIDQAGKEHYFWPPTLQSETNQTYSPAVAVRMTIDLAELGTISHLWLILKPSHITDGGERLTT